jgi:hypothetical protein
MPVNLPTHGHGHGYSDLNFLIPELVSGVQFSKGPYFADQGDFATAGSANINYASVLDQPIVRIGGGGEGFGRAFVAASPPIGTGHLLGALEVEHNDGPWDRPDDYRKVNGLVRYSRGDAINGLSITGMGYSATWNSTDQIPLRAIDEGAIDRFGGIDNTDGGDTYRYSGRSSGSDRGTTRRSSERLRLRYDLNLFSNFTFFLDDPSTGISSSRPITASSAAPESPTVGWDAGLDATSRTVGVQLRDDDITSVGLYHTEARRVFDIVRQDAVLQTSGAGFAQNETAWTPWLRTVAGVRADGYQFRVDASDPDNSGARRSGLVSPKGGAVIGPFYATEFYVNAGLGYHSNDARGATMTLDPSTGERADPATPLARAKGAEVGVRSVAARHLQSSLTLWTLSLASELVFVGDAGTTEPSRPSHRYGVEWTNYWRRGRLILDGDCRSRAHFVDVDPWAIRSRVQSGRSFSGGATIDSVRNVFGSVRLRYFGPRALVEDGPVRSAATSLVNVEGGYKLAQNVSSPSTCSTCSTRRTATSTTTTPRGCRAKRERAATFTFIRHYRAPHASTSLWDSEMTAASKNTRRQRASHS